MWSPGACPLAQAVRLTIVLRCLGTWGGALAAHLSSKEPKAPTGETPTDWQRDRVGGHDACLCAAES